MPPSSRSGTGSGSTSRSRCSASPDVLLLDEPTASLDPQQRRRVWEIARGVADRGGGVLVATHHWEELGARADRTLELVEGQLT